MLINQNFSITLSARQIHFQAVLVSYCLLCCSQGLFIALGNYEVSLGDLNMKGHMNPNSKSET